MGYIKSEECSIIPISKQKLIVQESLPTEINIIMSGRWLFVFVTTLLVRIIIIKQIFEKDSSLCKQTLF